MSTTDLSGDVAATVAVASATTAYVYVAVGSVQRMYVTTDGGAHLRRVPVPTVGSSGTSPPVAHLVFPTPTAGYAVLGEALGDKPALMMTTDGARSWRRVSLPLSTGASVTVAGHGSRVYAAIDSCPSSAHCDPVQLWSSRTGSSRFTRVAGSLPARGSPAGAGLAAYGRSVWVMLGLGGPKLDVARSTDGGASFTIRTGRAALDCSPTATSTQVIWTSCSGGMLMSFQRDDGDAAARNLSVGGSGTGGTFLDPVSDNLAFFGTEGGRWAGLYVTHDAGRHFTKVSNGPPGYLTTAGSPPAFLSPMVGLAIDVNDNLFRTTDGGATWQPVMAPTS